MKILILSELYDVSTNNVMDYLVNMEHEVFRINTEDKIEDLLISFSNSYDNVSFKVRNNEIQLNKYDKIWYRRGYLSFSYNTDLTKIENKITRTSIRHNLLNEELLTIKEYIEQFMYSKLPLKGLNSRSSNKLIALKKAKEAGLLIPKSIVSSQKVKLINFFQESNKHCISKGVQDILLFAIKNTHILHQKYLKKTY